MNYGYTVHVSPGEPQRGNGSLKVGQQVLGRMTLSGNRELVRKGLGNTFVAGGTSHSGGLPLLSTGNRIYVYCSLQLEFFSPEKEEGISSEGITSNTAGRGTGRGLGE